VGSISDSWRAVDALRSPSRRSRNVRAMGIRERPISFRSPWQSICGAANWYRASRELNRMLIFGEAHLRQILRSYAAYYEIRTDLGFGKDTLLGRAVQRSGTIVAIHHHYIPMYSSERTRYRTFRGTSKCTLSMCRLLSAVIGVGGVAKTALCALAATIKG
jgi:hypothetical protein